MLINLFLKILLEQGKVKESNLSACQPIAYITVTISERIDICTLYYSYSASQTFTHPNLAHNQM